MLRPLWYSSETYVSYNDVVDKWGLKAALRDSVLDALSAAIALNLVFPERTVAEVTKDLLMSRRKAISESKEKV